MFHSSEEYMHHASIWFDQNQQNITKRHIYVMTDGISVLPELQKKYAVLIIHVLSIYILLNSN